MSLSPEAQLTSDADYRRLAGGVLSAIEDQLDRWLQGDVVDIDSQRTGGLLELTLPDRSKVVVNLQPPLQELWLATRAGGHHYRLVAGHWVDSRDGTEFFESLSNQVSAQAGVALRFIAPTA